MKYFNSREFVDQLALDVISNFDRASRATTPTLIGSSREVEVRRKLESLLPSGVGVGSGCVIDVSGNCSKQQDVIIYEKSICPVFSINENPEASYFPCEGVIAVGEVKSKIGKAEIIDCFEKIESVKKIKRFEKPYKSLLSGLDIVSYRKYLNTISFDTSSDDQFDQNSKFTDQIFSFILCGDFSIDESTLSTHIKSLIDSKEVYLLPNLIVSLNAGIYDAYNSSSNTLCRAVMNGNGYVYGKPENGNFQHLLAYLHDFVNQGRTVDADVFKRYLVNDPDKMTLKIETCVLRS